MTLVGPSSRPNSMIRSVNETERSEAAQGQ